MQPVQIGNNKLVKFNTSGASSSVSSSSYSILADNGSISSLIFSGDEDDLSSLPLSRPWSLSLCLLQNQQLKRVPTSEISPRLKGMRRNSLILQVPFMWFGRGAATAAAHLFLDFGFTWRFFPFLRLVPFAAAGTGWFLILVPWRRVVAIFVLWEQI